VTPNSNDGPGLHDTLPYEIVISGTLPGDWSEWIGPQAVATSEATLTTINGNFDQAALQGMIRRIYALGIPLVSVRIVTQQTESGS